MKTSVCMLVVVVIVSVFHPIPNEGRADEQFVTIGSADANGVYFSVGRAIAQLLNAKRREHGIRATVEATRGSVFNINAIMAGYLAFGLAQSDKQYMAVNGLAEWRPKGPQEDLRSVFSLHLETVNLVAAVDAGIDTPADLKGKRLNLGNKGSGQYQNAIDVLVALNLDPRTDIVTRSVSTTEAVDLIQDRRIDAFFCTLGHPNELLHAATSGNRKVRFIPLTGAFIDPMVTATRYYLKTVLPVGKHYPGAEGPSQVDTFGVVATLCTSADVSEKVVYTLVKEVMDNLDDLKKRHPALGALTAEGMRSGLNAPVHRGARRYYREAGLSD